MLGSFVADAVAMPVHWYYDVEAMDRDYGEIDDYLNPRNPHPDSLLHRAFDEIPDPIAEILHDQSRYWGMAGTHYHQFLTAGDNTINYRLAAELFQMIVTDEEYQSEKWLHHYISRMKTPGWNKDTYLEEYHRGFFMKLADGKSPGECAIDDHHIGGLSQIPALIAGLAAMGDDRLDFIRAKVQRHIELTHANKSVIRSGDILARLLYRIAEGDDLEVAYQGEVSSMIPMEYFQRWEKMEDRQVIGQLLSPACYIEQSFPSSLFLVWKYRNDFTGGVIANARVGGDNCHRGAVVGSLLGALNGVPEKWFQKKWNETLPA